MEQDNKELLKKIAYLAVGIFSPESEHFSEMVDGWIEKGKMTEAEGKKFVEEVMEKAKTTKSDLEKTILEQSQSFYENIHIATTDQINALNKRITALEELHKSK